MQYYPTQSASPEIRKKNQTKQQRTLQCKKKKKKLCKEGGNYTTLLNSHKLWQILYTLRGSFFRPHQYPLLTLATFKSIPPLGGGGKGGGAERRSSVATFRLKNIKNISLQKNLQPSDSEILETLFCLHYVHQYRIGKSVLKKSFPHRNCSPSDFNNYYTICANYERDIDSFVSI